MKYFLTNKIAADALFNNRWIRFSLSKMWAIKNKVIDKYN